MQALPLLSRVCPLHPFPSSPFPLSDSPHPHPHPIQLSCPAPSSICGVQMPWAGTGFTWNKAAESLILDLEECGSVQSIVSSTTSFFRVWKVVIHGKAQLGDPGVLDDKETWIYLSAFFVLEASFIWVSHCWSEHPQEVACLLMNLLVVWGNKSTVLSTKTLGHKPGTYSNKN